MRLRRWALVAAVGVVTGCLPLGEPPVGERRLATRAPGNVQLVRAAGALWLLIWQDREDREGADLLVTTVDGGEPRRIAERIDAGGSTLCRDAASACTFSIDGNGRILLRPWQAPPPGGFPPTPGLAAPLIRVGLGSGNTEDLGPVAGWQTSASGERLALIDQLGTIRVAEADGHVTTLERVGGTEFVREDLFYMTREASPGRLWVLPASGAARPVSEAVVSFHARAVAETPVIIVTHPAGARAPTSSLLDPETLVETALPAGRLIDFSPDGRRVALFPDESLTAITFFDRQSQTSEVVPVPGSVPRGSWGVFWRPHHDEAWIPTGDRTFVWRPGAAVTVMLGTPFAYERRPGNMPVLFTADGAHWFAAEYSAGGSLQDIFLVAADDAGKRLRLTPPGTVSTGYWPLLDGRLLVEAWTTDVMRNDLYVVDAHAGTQRSVGSGGNVVAAGAGRILAQLHWLKAGGSGDLTLIDVDTGTHRLLAENVHAIAMERNPDDALAPGVRVAFVVRNRLASPFDGVWVATLP